MQGVFSRFVQTGSLGAFSRENRPCRPLRLFSVANDGPRKLVGSEVFWNRTGEEAPPPASEKVRGLSLIGTARLDAIVGADGNIRLLLEILVEIAKQHTDASVRIRKPAFKGRGDPLATVVRRPHRDGLLRECKYEGRAHRDGERDC